MLARLGFIWAGVQIALAAALTLFTIAFEPPAQVSLFWIQLFVIVLNLSQYSFILGFMAGSIAPWFKQMRLGFALWGSSALLGLTVLYCHDKIAEGQARSAAARAGAVPVASATPAPSAR